MKSADLSNELSKPVHLQELFSITFKHPGRPGCTQKSMEKQLSLHFSLPNQLLLLAVPPLQESVGVLKPF